MGETRSAFSSNSQDQEGNGSTMNITMAFWGINHVAKGGGTLK
jgi:hypothetical protein